MTTREERAKRRNETWAMEAFSSDGTLLASNGKSTSLTPEGAGVPSGDPDGRYLQALAAVRELVYGKAAVSARLDRTKVVKSSRPVAASTHDE